MHIAVVGGGFTGLSAARTLLLLGHKVTLFEAESVLGGLAHGFREKSWDWHLEYAYHHFFTNETALLRLIEELGMKRDILILRPNTSTYIDGTVYRMDSPLSLLTFPKIPFSDRIRTGIVMAGCKVNPFWKPLENYTAEEVFRTLGGAKGWEAIWNPLLTGKFSKYADSISAAWLWARIKKRTMALGYIRGGFQTLIKSLAKDIAKKGGIIHTGIRVRSISRQKYTSFFRIRTDNGIFKADRVLLTTPSGVCARIVPDLPKKYTQALADIPHLTAQILILATPYPILRDVYWLNINDRSFPFLAAVAHTNFVSPKYYGNTHLTYFGNYLPDDHPYLHYSKQKLLKTFLPYIQKLNPNSTFQILNSYHFVAPYAQPVHTQGYSKRAPRFKTPIDGLYLANLDSVVPWDRGTNYAVELGQTVTDVIHQTN